MFSMSRQCATFTCWGSTAQSVDSIETVWSISKHGFRDIESDQAHIFNMTKTVGKWCARPGHVFHMVTKVKLALKGQV